MEGTAEGTQAAEAGTAPAARTGVAAACTEVEGIVRRVHMEIEEVGHRPGSRARARR